MSDKPMDDATRYQKVDLPFYRQNIAPLLPPRVLDFHAHAWTKDQWSLVPWEDGASGAKYMVTQPDYPVEQMDADLKRMFPDRPSAAVCFGYPTPAADLEKTNAALALAAGRGHFPLMIVGRGTTPPDRIEQAVRKQGFFGYKVLLNWYGNDYGNVAIPDMIGPDEMKIADRLGLIVLLHVPRSGRLADPVVQQGVRALAAEYPRASIVLAHCGRCYLPDEMQEAIGCIRDLPNVFMDTSMVMEPAVLQIAMEAIGSRRLLFATDLPVAAMRGRRVYVMDHWVDVVLEGYAESDYRVASSGIRATFMAYEIVLAIARAGRLAGIDQEEIRRIFCDNGMALIDKARNGVGRRS